VIISRNIQSAKEALIAQALSTPLTAYGKLGKHRHDDLVDALRRATPHAKMMCKVCFRHYPRFLELSSCCGREMMELPKEGVLAVDNI
jgi:hypothetical protein